jgi:hypothetical protein
MEKELEEELEEELASGAAKYTCLVCGLSVSSRRALNRHKKGHNKKFACSSCSLKYGTMGELNTHFRTSHGKKDLPCPHCDQMFSVNSKLKQHLNTHVPGKWSCNKCGKLFCRNAKLQKHILNAHPKPNATKIHCTNSKCRATFTNTEALNDHLKRCHLNLPCPLCSAVFSDKDCLRRHALLHVTGKKYTCPRCFEEVSNWGEYLTSHCKSCPGIISRQVQESAIEEIKKRLVILKTAFSRHHENNMIAGSQTILVTKLFKFMSGCTSKVGSRIVVDQSVIAVGDHHLNHFNIQNAITDWSILDDICKELLVIIQLTNLLRKATRQLFTKHPQASQQSLHSPGLVTHCNKTLKGPFNNGHSVAWNWGGSNTTVNLRVEHINANALKFLLDCFLEPFIGNGFVISAVDGIRTRPQIPTEFLGPDRGTSEILYKGIKYMLGLMGFAILIAESPDEIYLYTIVWDNAHTPVIDMTRGSQQVMWRTIRTLTMPPVIFSRILGKNVMDLLNGTKKTVHVNWFDGIHGLYVPQKFQDPTPIDEPHICENSMEKYQGEEMALKESLKFVGGSGSSAGSSGHKKPKMLVSFSLVFPYFSQ